MKGQLLKRALKGNRPVAGAMIKLPVTPIVHMAANGGFDFVILDWEHGTFDMSGIENMLVAADASGIPAVVRVPVLSEYHILHSLDMGASGIMVPHVETCEQAERAVEYSLYPPHGGRGLGSGVRAAGYGKLPLGEYVQKANESTLIMVQIETERGVDELEQIASTEYIDVLHTGPSDLSSSLGVTGQRTHPRVVTAMKKVAEAAKSHGKVFAVPASPSSDMSEWIKEGAACFTYGADIDILNRGYAEIIRGLNQSRKAIAN